MTSDRGSVSIWVLGLSMLLLLFGGLALDYWRGLALQRELAAVADSAALAGASGIDEAEYRVSGTVVLDEGRAIRLVEEAVGRQGLLVRDLKAEVGPSSIRVTLTAELDPLLLGVFISDDRPLVVRAVSSARPEYLP